MTEEKDENIVRSFAVRRSRLDWLEEKAKDKETSVNYIVNVAIKEYIEKEESNG